MRAWQFYTAHHEETNSSACILTKCRIIINSTNGYVQTTFGIIDFIFRQTDIDPGCVVKDK